ncbi:MAG: SPOR domain-containing protein [Deltaproteobacteria bacterium]|nr:SPOR domain-containing protein [Deltaproteobacteria bacterium]
MMEQGSVRNLEQIQETDGESTPRGVTLLLVALGGACIVFAGLALGGRRAAPTAQKTDPLGELVTQQAKTGTTAASAAARSTELSARDVTFPGILSDEGSPTTALAAVKGPRPSMPPAGPGGDPSSAIALNVRGAGVASDGVGTTPTSPEGRLPVVPLPAQNMLGASPVVTRPRDSLTRAASDASQADSAAAGPPASAGREGGFQLQVSSFRTQGEADQFATQLRARGHKAYVVEAHVPGRGTWFRVRIGPFPSQHAAASYRSGFEGREHVVPFIVPPNK